MLINSLTFPVEQEKRLPQEGFPFIVSALIFWFSLF